MESSSSSKALSEDDIIDPQIPGEESAPVKIPFYFADRHGVLIEYRDEQLPLLVHRSNMSLQTLVEVRRFLGANFDTEKLDDTKFQTRLTMAYQTSGNDFDGAMADIDSDMDLTRLADEIPEDSDLALGEDDAPIIRLINAILSQAVRDKASDIHIETFESNLIIRFRTDGVLNEVLKPSRMMAPLLVSRLKVMAKLDIAERRIPQDGRISVKIAGHAIDIRLSTIPSAHGERIVLRLLDKQAGQLELDQLQMHARCRDAFASALHTPHGIILVTGPTGSGKTTTLYAGLTHINQVSRNILTIEDPIEYMLKGIGQTQVNTKVEMTFARGLRAILRQDPDVVMVGEIRDMETAEIAVQASLTGHLVLSTLHTNTAIGAVTRLQDMGIEPFLISSSLLAVMAQRLVRVLCRECKKPYTPSPAELNKLGLSESDSVRLYHSVGCKSCNNLGYAGRTGIYEFIEVDDKLRNLIHERAGEYDMTQYARKISPSIFDDGKRRVLAGDTTLEEVLRVTQG